MEEGSTKSSASLNDVLSLLYAQNKIENYGVKEKLLALINAINELDDEEEYTLQKLINESALLVSTYNMKVGNELKKIRDNLALLNELQPDKRGLFNSSKKKSLEILSLFIDLFK